MESINSEIDHKIEEMLQAIRPQFEMLLSTSPGNRESILDGLCGRIASEGKILLSTEIDILTDDCLKRPFFASAKNHNLFWKRNLAQDILGRYDFSYSPPKDGSTISSPSLVNPILAATGTVALGAILSSVFNPAIVIPITIVVAVAVFVFVKKYIEGGHLEARSKLVDDWCMDLKTQLNEWLLVVKEYFDCEINKIEHAE